MKIRMRPNSIRLRLRQSDVRELIDKGRCERAITFGINGQQLVYALRLADETSIVATFDSGTITITLPHATASEWAETDQVGIEALQDTGGEPLEILIEKDFECIDGNSAEPQDDAFPNPLANCGPSRD